uniref:Putative secreted protein n=1 Tax=Anopheles marajoara TaxID=58244 RepID=A0A2M4C7P7_9DIPT
MAVLYHSQCLLSLSLFHHQPSADGVDGRRGPSEYDAGRDRVGRPGSPDHPHHPGRIHITRRDRSSHSKTSTKGAPGRVGVDHPIPTISQRLSSQYQSQEPRCVTFANDYELHDVVTRM